MLAFIKEQTSKVTLDALYKEMVVTSLPADIQRAMADKLDALDAQGAADLADAYFDKDGKVLIPSSSINAVDQPLQAAEADDGDFEVNAVGGRQKPFQRQRGDRNRPRHFGGKTTTSNGPSTASSAPSTSQQPRQPIKTTTQMICEFHLKYGEKAYTCVEGCSQWEKTRAKRGNARAGNRT